MAANFEQKIKPGDWFAVGQIFVGPYHYDDPKSGTLSAQKFGVNVGVQALTAVDYASKCPLHSRPVEKTPSPFTASEIVSFFKEIFEQHGKPRTGVLMSRSVWQSSTEILLDDELGEHANFLRGLDIEFGPMAASEKDKIVAWLGKHGVLIAFNEDKLNSQ